MGVDVDEAGGHDQSAGIDLPCAGEPLAHPHDALAYHGDIGVTTRTAGAVDHLAASNDQLSVSAHGGALLIDA